MNQVIDRMGIYDTFYLWGLTTGLGRR